MRQMALQSTPITMVALLKDFLILHRICLVYQHHLASEEDHHVTQI